MSVFTGCATALITPFLNDEPDIRAMRSLIDFQLDNGIDALVVCGTTGEASTMSYDERMKVIETATEHTAGRVPVIAGTGGNDTKQVIRASKSAQSLGANALLIVTPYYNKTSQKGLLVHYYAIADSVDIPIIVYNIPGRTGLNVKPETMLKLLEHKNIVGVKEASGNIEQITELAALCRDCDIYCGNDDHVIPVMSLGGKGVISTVANIIPRDMRDMCHAFLDCDIERARELQFKIRPIWKAAFSDVNPIPIKAMAAMLGMCSKEIRLPLIAPDEDALSLLRQALIQYGLLS